VTVIPPFAKETDLCAAFIAAMPEGWVAYPETGGFDILMVRTADGMQIGVEAKLKLNAKVIAQAAEAPRYHNAAGRGPDCRAVLVPEGVGMDLVQVCHLVGVTVIKMRHGDTAQHYSSLFHPELPRMSTNYWEGESWYERCPAQRLDVPDWVPDVRAGDSAPVALTHWKIGAIKLVITLERRGYLTRQDFAHFKISMSRWTQERWLVKDGQGGWIAGPYFPNFKLQHPVNFDQIAADYEKWKAPESASQPGLFVGGAA
tara:strand:- start:35727 stop:36500 length:774 start_codon:yes stop_codon:yes gene_type:complete